MKESTDIENIKNQFRNYLLELHKNPSTSSEYVRWMDEIQDWFISNGICESDFNIWLDTNSISSINFNLGNEKKKVWKQFNKEKNNWYSAPWNKWVAFNRLKTIEKESLITVSKILYHTNSFITSKGFHYTKEEIANFYLSLKTKPFVILAGISGTGKTQLPRKFAEALGMSKDQVIQVPVRPDWTDGSDLLGYTGLDEEFKPKELSLAIIKANSNPGKPYFFILDEMNLARVEHYFSDFLSIIETRDRKNDIIITDPILKKEVLEKAKNAEEYAGLTWPENLYLIGTVNMDETTHAFSRKVLDRANTIEMNEVNLNWIKSNNNIVEALGDINNSFFKTEFIGSIDLKEEEKKSVEENINLLKKVNEILKKADLHFAYRVRDEVAFYLILNKKYGLLEERTAMDFQLVQKVLPRIHGSSERVQIVLVELLNLLEGTSFRAENFEFGHLNGKISEASLKYRRSSSKIIFMLKRYDDDRFTSFWL